MSNIDKQALREAAVRAGGVKWQYMRATQHTKAYIADEKGWTVVNCTDGDVPAKCAGFLTSANPATVLALLDELETKEEQRANWFQIAQKLGDDLDAAEKRIAELEARQPYGYLRENDGQIQISIGHERPHDRSGGYATPWFAIYTATGISTAATDVLTERQRQMSVEGWTPEHDDEHVEGQLSDAAACYALFATDQRRPVPAHWPWSGDWWKQRGQRRDLVRAGALILAEIERLDRAAMNNGGEA